MEYSKKQGQSKVSTSGASWKYTLPCIGRIFKRTIPSVSRICYKMEPKITFSDYLSHLQILINLWPLLASMLSFKSLLDSPWVITFICTLSNKVGATVFLVNGFLPRNSPKLGGYLPLQSASPVHHAKPSLFRLPATG